MDLKQKIFILILILIIIFPLFFSKKDIKIEKEIQLPNMSVLNGKFEQYEINLTKKGKFGYLEYYNDNYYKVSNLYVKFLDRKSKLFAKKLIFDKKYNLYDVKYITPDYIYLAKKAIYFDNNKTLIAFDFEFFNEKIDGTGKKMIYLNNIIYANDIKYILKGIK